MLHKLKDQNYLSSRLTTQLESQVSQVQGGVFSSKAPRAILLAAAKNMI